MQFLWDNPKKAVEMGKNAQKRYYEIFTAKSMITEYTKLYQSLV